MKWFLAFAISLLAASAQAQDGSWTIRLNGRVLLNTSTEGQVRKISSYQWKRSGRLEIRFYESQKNFWIRTFMLHDESDNLVVSYDSVQRVSIPLSKLRRLFAGKKELRIYTVVRPINPNIAVRIRRVHLCTLRLP